MGRYAGGLSWYIEIGECLAGRLIARKLICNVPYYRIIHVHIMLQCTF